LLEAQFAEILWEKPMMEHTMKYADTHEFTSQIELATPCSKSRKSFRQTIKLRFKSLFATRFDPTRLKAAIPTEPLPRAIRGDRKARA